MNVSIKNLYNLSLEIGLLEEIASNLLEYIV